MKKIAIIILTLGLISGSASVNAQGVYPNREIEMVIPFGAGGASDILGRVFADELGKTLKVPIVVLNKPGGGTLIALSYVHNAKKDGYTLLLGAFSVLAGSAMAGGAPYSFVNDFIPFPPVISTTLMVYVKNDSPFKTFGELIEKAKKNPGAVTTGGVMGGTANLNVTVLEKAAGVKFTNVPLKSGLEVITSCLGGHIDFGVGLIAPSLSYIRSGQMRFLAVIGSKRLKDFPNVPTLKELGFTQTFFDSDWQCLFAPAGVPQQVIDTLKIAGEKVGQSKEMIPKIARFGYAIESESMNVAEFRKRMESDDKFIQTLFDELGLKGKQ